MHQNRLTCSECKLRGHSSDCCPNIWRRYHSTTEQHINPNNTVNNNPRKYCCNYGAHGFIKTIVEGRCISMEIIPRHVLAL
ncbi:hypothetical protein DOY81_012605 [Sarcophaga bullata]|nr:hypothetical protein DOY81_012605 [Sarcophaga bullata]